MILDAQFNASRWTWTEIRKMALEVEDQGFGTIWVVDHLSGQPFGGSRMLESFTLAGALASATTTLGVGTMVANVALRPPSLLAVSAASVQEISDGRFTFGVGAGAAPGTRWSTEHEVAGIELAPTAAGRHERLIRVLDVCDQMWDANRGDEWEGFPLPSPRPPIVVGVNSVALAELVAGRCQGINVRFDHPNVTGIIEAAQAARAASPLADTPLSISVWTMWTDETEDPDGEFQHELAALGVDHLMLVR